MGLFVFQGSVQLGLLENRLSGDSFGSVWGLPPSGRMGLLDFQGSVQLGLREKDISFESGLPPGGLLPGRLGLFDFQGSVQLGLRPKEFLLCPKESLSPVIEGERERPARPKIPPAGERDRLSGVGGDVLWRGSGEKDSLRLAALSNRRRDASTSLAKRVHS